eukprot:10232436-Prorocentrum_lima.AAC.1
MRTCAHGPSASLLLSALDEGAKGDISEDDAIELAHACFDQLRGRFLVNTPSHQVFVIDASGIRSVPRAAQKAAETPNA